jgi:hypothetical protein
MQRYNGEVLFEAIMRDIYFPKMVPALTKPPGAEKDEKLAELKEKLWPSICKSLDAFLPADKKFINGDQMT